MHVENWVDEIGRHVLEHLVVQDSCVVDDDVEAPVCVESGLHDRRTAVGVRDAVDVGDSLTATGPDFADQQFGNAAVGSLTGHRPADVVDDDLRTAGCQQQSVRLSQSLTGTGDDRNSTVESQFTHSPSSLLGHRAREGAVTRQSTAEQIFGQSCSVGYIGDDEYATTPPK